MRKYPRKTFGEWQIMSRSERKAYADHARAESAMLRAERERLKSTPQPFHSSQTHFHRWLCDVSARSLTGPYRYKGRDDLGTNGVVDEKTGVTNPSWRKQIASFQNATTAYVRRSGVVRDKPGAISAEVIVTGDRRRVELSGDLVRVATSLAQASETAAEQRARIDFYKKLKRTQTELAGGVFLGEIREAAALIRKPFIKIPELINGYSRQAKAIARVPKKRLTWSQREKKLADAWLTTSFGILPLASDVEDAAKALASLLNQGRHRRVRGIGIDELQSQSLTPLSLYTPGDGSTGLKLALETHTESWAQCKVRYVGGVVTRAVGPDLSSMPDISRRFGVGVSDFIPTIYELLPWSFLVDYFATVGDVLNAWAVSYADVKWQSKSVLHQCESKKSGVINDAGTRQYSVGLQYCIGYPGSCTAFDYTYTRSNPGVVPLPQLEFRSALSPWKAMNLWALRRQLQNVFAPLVRGR